MPGVSRQNLGIWEHPYPSSLSFPEFLPVAELRAQCRAWNPELVPLRAHLGTVTCVGLKFRVGGSFGALQSPLRAALVLFSHPSELLCCPRCPCHLRDPRNPQQEGRSSAQTDSRGGRGPGTGSSLQALWNWVWILIFPCSAELCVSEAGLWLCFRSKPRAAPTGNGANYSPDISGVTEPGRASWNAPIAETAPGLRPRCARQRCRS